MQHFQVHHWTKFGTIWTPRWFNTKFQSWGQRVHFSPRRDMETAGRGRRLIGMKWPLTFPVDFINTCWRAARPTSSPKNPHKSRDYIFSLAWNALSLSGRQSLINWPLDDPVASSRRMGQHMPANLACLVCTKGSGAVCSVSGTQPSNWPLSGSSFALSELSSRIDRRFAARSNLAASPCPGSFRTFRQSLLT